MTVLFVVLTIVFFLALDAIVRRVRAKKAVPATIRQTAPTA